MIPANRIPTHPGEILKEEFLKPLGITQTAFARHIGVSTRTISEFVLGHRGVSAELAWKLAQALGTSPELWLNLQAVYDLATHQPKQPVKLLQPAMA